MKTNKSGFWILMLGLSIFVLVSGKNVSYLFGVTALSLALLSLARDSGALRKLSGILFCIALLAMFSSVDVDARRGRSLDLRWMPVVYNLGSAELVRQEETKGHKADEDFIVKRNPPLANHVHSSLVLFFPL